MFEDAAMVRMIPSSVRYPSATRASTTPPPSAVAFSRASNTCDRVIMLASVRSSRM